MPTAACVVLTDATLGVLLVRENYGARRWGFPGGRVDADEGVSEAAVREAREEAGVDVTITHVLGHLNWLDADDRWTATVFEGEIRAAKPAIQDSDEIADIGWFPKTDLPSPLTRTARAWADDVLLRP